MIIMIIMIIIIIIIIIIQDQALQTKYLATKIVQTKTDNKCKLCKQFDETVERLISARPIMAKEQYIKRHDRVCAQLHFNICKEIVVKLDNKHWYDRVLKSVETIREGKVIILWIRQMRTDRTIPNNKPDIIIHDNKKGTCTLIDVAIPGDSNVFKKEAEKILKYKDLIILIQHMWNVKAKAILVTIRATGNTTESFRQYQDSMKLRN
jgi:hypothetical protein